MQDFIQLILFILPAYIANAVPVVLGGGQYLDFGMKFGDGERIFGNGKTIRGFIAGVASGTVAAAILAIYLPLPFFANAQLQFFGGFMLALGTMVGDAIGSSIKRRMKMQPGKQFVLDQLSFLIVALIFVFPFVNPSVYEPVGIVFLFVLTYLMHSGTNLLANKMGLKSVPW
ncbi:MAG: CDP-2,3-bis-(O-geranylgeranyl)-sn-glycerol synthase [Candidatus Micrarchaeia archaeon]